MSIVHSVVVVIFIRLIIARLRREQLCTIARPLIRANHQLAQELVAQAIEVIAVEGGVLALLQV